MTEEQGLTLGQTVRLKSGGPKMTVTNIGESLGRQMVWCVWFDGSRRHEDTFPPDALEPFNRSSDYLFTSERFPFWGLPLSLGLNSSRTYSDSP
jgi:uncharacterized protein YodC (DUF2158 family)